MKKIVVIISIMLWSSPLLAETYSWVDENGVANFTEDLSQVPKKYRKKVQRREDITYEPVTKPSEGQKKPVAEKKTTPETVAVPAPKSPQESPAAANRPAANGELFAGKTREQWQKELTASATEANAINRNIDEMVAFSKRPEGMTRERSLTFPIEYNDLLKKHKEAVARYNVLLEAARKAGLDVDLIK